MPLPSGVAVFGLAKIELIFSTAALTALGFVVVARKVLITHQCLAEVLHSIEPVLHTWAGGYQDPGRGHSQESWPKLTKGLFHTL